MKGFRSYLTEQEPERTSHLCWGEGDVEHHLREDSGHMVLSHQAQYTHHSRFPDLLPVHTDELHAHIAYRRSLEQPELRALQRYKRDSEDHYNKLLRKLDRHSSDGSINVRKPFVDDDDEYRHRYESMDKAVSHTLGHTVIGYRGYGGGIKLHEMPVGHEFTDHGYTGLSLEKETSRSYGMWHGNDHASGLKYHDGLRMGTSYALIHAPKGTAGHLLSLNRHYGKLVSADERQNDPHNHKFHLPHEDEEEFVLHRGTRFRVMGHSRVGDYGRDGPHDHIVHLQAIGQDPKKLVY